MTETLGDRTALPATSADVPAPRGNPAWLDRLVARVTRTEATHETLRARNARAADLFRERRHDEAAREFGETLELCRDLLGDDHADTLVTMGNLAAAHVAGGRPGQAVPLLERAVADRARLRGATHPATLDARHGLGVALRDAGDAQAACTVLRSTLADRTVALGPTHPDTVGTHQALATADARAR